MIQGNHFLALFSLVFIISSLMAFVLKNIVMGGWTADAARITPVRWIAATSVSVAVVSWGHQRKSLSTTGALFAIIVGFCLTLAQYSYMASLLMFFFSSSQATKYKASIKKKFEENFREGGQRNWLQVLCNGGVAMELSLLYLLDIGSQELPVDFRQSYRASWLGMGILGAISCCNGDTWASELGSVWSSGDPWLITSFKRVPRGTNGGVSIPGLLASVLGGMAIGVAYLLALLLACSPVDLAIAPPQWKIILVAGLGGLLGSLIDSLLGATLQFSGKDARTGKIVEVRRDGVIPIAGKQILDNHSVNLIASIITALILPKIAINMGM